MHCVTSLLQVQAPPTFKPQKVQTAWKSSVVSESIDAESRDTYNIGRVVEGTDACRKVGIDVHNITGPSTIYRNLSYPELFEHEKANNEGVVANAEYGETFVVDTGKYTGRSPKDKWVVRNVGSESDQNIDWNPINQPTEPEVFDELYEKAIAYFNTLDKVSTVDNFLFIPEWADFACPCCRIFSCMCDSYCTFCRILPLFKTTLGLCF